MLDAYGRAIDYLRLSVTDLCDLRCIYCMPESGVPHLPHSNILRVEECIDIAKTAVELGIRKIRITGGEPLVRRGILEIAGDYGYDNGGKFAAAFRQVMGVSPSQYRGTALQNDGWEERRL